MRYRDTSVQGIFRQLFPTALLAIAWLLTSPAGAAGSDPCTTAVPVSLNDTFFGDSRGPGEVLLVKADLPTAGVVMLDVVVPTPKEVETKLDYFSRPCGELGDGQGHPVVVAWSVTSLVLAVPSPGTYAFRVAAQDPQLPLGEYEVRIGFVSADHFAEGVYRSDCVPLKDIEIDPDLLTVLAQKDIEIDPDLLTVLAQKDIEIDPDLLAVLAQKDIEIDPDLLAVLALKDIEIDPDLLAVLAQKDIEIDPDLLRGGSEIGLCVRPLEIYKLTVELLDR